MSFRLLRSTAIVGINTFISRILGFVRDILIAALFGAGAGADAFFVAFRIPNFLRRLFAEGAFSQAFVPVLSEYRANSDHQEVRDFSAHVAGSLGVSLFAVTLIGVLIAPMLVMVFAPGFLQHEDKFDLTVQMLRITFPYLLFVSLTSFAGGILNAYGRFGVPAITPVFLNLALIASAVWLAPHMEAPVVALAWGVFAAGVVQLVFQLPFLYRLRLLARPRYRRGHEGVKKVIRLIIPAIFGVSVSQVNLLVDTLIASFLVTGSVSWLYYSDRLVEFPLGVFGIALATVILPSLSEKHARESVNAFSETLDWALRWVWLIALPAATALAILATPLIATLFNHGEFSDHDVAMSARSLMAYAVGLLGFVLIKVLAPGFYSRQDTRTPVRIGVVAMVANMILNVVLVFPFAHAGLALATSLAAFINAGLLYRELRRQKVYNPVPGWSAFALRVLIANLVMAVALWVAKGDVEVWLLAQTSERGIRLALLILGGMGIYFGVLIASGLRLRTILLAGRK